MTTVAGARAGQAPDVRHQGSQDRTTDYPIHHFRGANLAGDLPPVGQSRVSSSRQSESSASPTEIPQARVSTAIPTGIPRTKRHYAVNLLCVLKARKSPLTSVYARELRCLSFSR